MVGRERVVTDSLLHRPNLIIVLCFVGGVIGCCVCGESKREFQKVSTWSHEKRQKSSDEKDAKYFGSKKINDKCFGNG